MKKGTIVHVKHLRMTINVIHFNSAKVITDVQYQLTYQLSIQVNVYTTGLSPWDILSSCTSWLTSTKVYWLKLTLFSVCHDDQKTRDWHNYQTSTDNKIYFKNILSRKMEMYVHYIFLKKKIPPLKFHVLPLPWPEMHFQSLLLLILWDINHIYTKSHQWDQF